MMQVAFLYYELKKSKSKDLDFFICAEGTTSFDQRSTSFQSEKLLRNFARTSFLICSAQMNEVALRANGKEHLSHIGATILHPNTKALFYKAFSVF